MTIEGDDNYPFRTYPEGDPYYDTHDECCECGEWYDIKVMRNLEEDASERICPDCDCEDSDEEDEEDEEEQLCGVCGKSCKTDETDDLVLVAEINGVKHCDACLKEKVCKK